MPVPLDSSKRTLFPQYLTEALPYIQHLYGCPIVIKVGGNVLDSPEDKLNFAQDIVLLRCVGIKPVVVHGGGPQITKMMNRLGKEATFVEGLRVTDQDTMDITEMVLAGTIGKQLVSAINSQGGKAVSLSGKDANLIEAKKALASGKASGDILDLGFVGEVVNICPQILKTLEEDSFIPVISPVGVGSDGHTYNINADIVAGEIAAALKAERLLLLTDTRGILEDPKDPATLISSLTLDDIPGYIEKGVIAGGMMPKVRACTIALEGDVKKTHIINGRAPHTIILELFTDEGVGTEIR